MQIPVAEINPVSIAVATILNMIAGMVWYHPRIFGTRWMRLVKLDPATAKEGMRKGMILGISATFIGTFFVATLQAIARPVTLAEALSYGVLWILAFLLPVHAGTVAWEQRPAALAFINFGWSALSVAITIVTVQIWPL